MRNRHLTRACAVLLSLLVLAGCAGKGSGGNVVKVGVLAPLSGVFADFGSALVKGTELAKNEINKNGGIQGKPVELIVEDNKSDPAVSVEKAKKLLTKDRVQFLTGTVGSSETLAVIPLAEQQKVPFFYTQDGEDKTCTPDGGTSKWIFGNGQSPEQLFAQFVPDMVKRFGKKIYFLGNDYVFPRSVIGIAKKMAQDAGAQVVAEEYVPLGTNSFDSIITKIQAAKPDILFTVVVGTDAIAFVKQANSYKLMSQMAVTGVATFAPDLYYGFAEYADGIYTVDRYSEMIQSPANEGFVKGYKEANSSKYPVGVIGPAGYGTLQLIKGIAEKAGTTDGEKFVAAAEGFKAKLPQGEVEIDAKNHMVNMPIYMLQIKNGQYQIVKDYGTATHPGHTGCSRLKQ